MKPKVVLILHCIVCFVSAIMYMYPNLGLSEHPDFGDLTHTEIVCLPLISITCSLHEDTCKTVNIQAIKSEFYDVIFQNRNILLCIKVSMLECYK